MKKYKYKTLSKNLANKIDYTLEDLNKLGEEGYKIVFFNFDDRGNEFIVLEKEWTDFP